MILLYHPRSTRPANRRFPLSILALAAVLEGREEYAIVDGNLEARPTDTVLRLIARDEIELLAVSVMPGPQMIAGMETCREVRRRFPRVPIVWGGYFPSLYTGAALNADYVDFAVRGQGEETLIELLDALRGRRSVTSVRGLSFGNGSGAHTHNGERSVRGPDAFPRYPYHRIPAEDYIRPSFFGRRTAVHQTSVGCPYRCTFCGVVSAYGSLQKTESPERTSGVLRDLQRRYSVDSVQFYDNNFFLKEDHAGDLMARLRPLGLRWWCEARVDMMLRFSDATLEAVRRAGCRMIFFGAESGSDWVLRDMRKELRAEQTLELAARIRQFAIIPEFSFVVGNPRDPERDTAESFDFIRRLKTLNPDAEIILYPYVPVPRRDAVSGDAAGEVTFPATLEEWATPRWQSFAIRKDPRTPWLRRSTQRKLDNFRVVLGSRWPTVQDPDLSGLGRTALRTLSGWRYRTRFYALPLELKAMQRLARLRRPEVESL